MSGYYFEDLKVGMQASSGKTVTEADILLFTAVSGDNNPIHNNDEYASSTQMRTRVVHAMLTASLLSGVLGCQMPGYGCLYVSQSTKFRAPVRPGDTVIATVTVSKLQPDTNFVEFETKCAVGEMVVLTGTSLLWVPSRPAED